MPKDIKEPVTQATFTQERFEKWLNRHYAGNSLFGELALSSLFDEWLKHEVSTTPIQKMESYRYMVLYEHPVVVHEPNWFYYLRGKLATLVEGKEEKELKFHDIQTAMNTINEKEAELRLQLAQVCNFQTYWKFLEESTSEIVETESEYPALEAFIHYAEARVGTIEFYEGCLQLKDEIYFAKMVVPEWVDVAQSALSQTKDVTYGDILEALKRIVN